MAKAKSNDLKPLGNENSYTQEFFDSLYEKISLVDVKKRSELTRSIISAAEIYLRYYGYYKTELPPHEINKNLQKALDYIDKAAVSLNKVYESGNFDRELINSLCEVVSEKYSSLHGVLKEVRTDAKFMPIIYPEKSMVLLSAMSHGIGRALENYKLRNATEKSRALNRWIVELAYKLEPIIGRKLEQSHYHKSENGGEYISKKKMNDSDLLKSIISLVDPNVTVSQIETAIKETRKERQGQQESRIKNYLLIQWIKAT